MPSKSTKKNFSTHHKVLGLRDPLRHRETLHHDIVHHLLYVPTGRQRLLVGGRLIEARFVVGDVEAGQKVRFFPRGAVD